MPSIRADCFGFARFLGKRKKQLSNEQVTTLVAKVYGMIKGPFPGKKFWE
jgi:hypothetical protein